MHDYLAILISVDHKSQNFQVECSKLEQTSPLVDFPKSRHGLMFHPYLIPQDRRLPLLL